MNEMPELRWEKLNSARIDTGWFTTEWETHRAMVHGGWLVLVRGEGSAQQSIAFYPDPDHRWNGGSQD
jgi:hypothetical protein